MPPPPEPALRLDAVARSFTSGKRTITAVNGITATAARGQVTGLIGPDGAGKTTLMRLIAGLLRPDAGTIQVLGIDVGCEPLKVQSQLGYMPQRFGLYEDLTVQENLDLYADLQNVAEPDRPARYSELLHLTGLGAFTSRMAGRLSGGMKQKLGLACTLLHPPAILLLDEPTVGVDPLARRELWQIIDHLIREAGMSVLFSTAYLDEAERCDNVLLIHDGNLLGSGPPASFTAEMAGHSYYATGNQPRRRLQARLAATPGIIDAVIQGSQVRVVTGTLQPPAVPDVSFTATAPRFEDSFVARLRAKAGAKAAPEPLAPPLPTTAAAADIIVVKNLTRRFGAFVAVDDVSFAVKRGEIFGLLGANGAGKSTTFRMLCGLLPLTAGSLRVAGFDLRNAAATARGRIGYMAQKFSLYDGLSVRENLRFFSSAYRLHGAHQKDRIAWAATEFDLVALMDTTARDLSLGFKQRLSLACALMHEPDILFLDEPTSGVDPLTRREFWRRINALAEAGVTVLVTTHFMEEAEYCDRLVIMAQGRVLVAGDPAAIKAQARSAGHADPSMEDAFIAIVEAASPRAAA